MALRHLAAERVDFLDQVSLADAADRRVARHLADVVEVQRDHQGVAAHACGGERRLDAGMARADDDHVEAFRKWSHDRALFHVEHYFPIQNSLKIASSTSSLVTRP